MFYEINSQFYNGINLKNNYEKTFESYHCSSRKESTVKKQTKTTVPIKNYFSEQIPK